MIDDAQLKELLKQAVREVLDERSALGSSPAADPTTALAEGKCELRKVAPAVLLYTFAEWGEWCRRRKLPCAPGAMASVCFDRSTRFVYFVQHASGPIKVGVAANVLGRIADLQTANPEPLRLLLGIGGNSTLEAAIHLALVHARIRGEWFAPRDEVLRLIELLRTCPSVFAFERSVVQPESN
jgi:hypothetical protein